MKRIYLIPTTPAVLTAILLLIAFTASPAQTLSFNRIYTLRGESSANSSYVPIDTVPAGKVWKITNYGVNGYSGVYSRASSSGGYIPWNTVSSSTPVYLAAPQGNASLSSVVSPIWLSSGEIIYFRNAVTTGRYLFSIIEFNVSP